MSSRVTRWAWTAPAALGLLIAAGCTPVPTSNADYQMYALAQGVFPESCAATPGPTMSTLSGNLTQVVESVDGVNEHVMRFAKGVGLGLSPTTGEVRNDAYSVVILFRFSEIGGFDRVLDFKSGTSDTGVYLGDGRLSFYPGSVGSRSIANDEWVQVVVTRTAGGTQRGFVDGSQQWSFSDTTGNGIISGGQLFFFRDNLSGGASNEHSSGAVARIRVFDRALSGDEIRALGQTPGSPCPA